MRIRTVLAVTAIAMIAAVGCGKHKKSQFQVGPPPAFPGSYALSCRNVTGLDAGFISAECADSKGHFDLSFIHASVCTGDIGNNNGLLVCNGTTATLTPPTPASAASAASSAAAASAATAAADAAAASSAAASSASPAAPKP